jgi:hypothetical protein
LPALEELQQRFTAWREAGRSGRRIPEELWEAATELARHLGVNPVSKAIGLDYTKLKRRLVTGDALPEQMSPNAVGAFVELAVDNVTRTPACIIEFEGRRGKLTIRLTEHNPTEVVTLAKALARGER